MMFNRLAEGEIQLPEFSRQEMAAKALAGIKPIGVAIENQMKEFELIPHKILFQVFGN